jgi:sugar lactone lactonase YvrE
MTSINRSYNDSLLFVTNVLNGTVAANGVVVHKGTVLRLDLEVSDSTKPHLESVTMIGSGFSERTDPAALVIGPTGLGLGADDILYIADSLNNRIAAITDASDRNSSAFTGQTVSQNGALNDPLGLTIAPSGHILTVNGNDGNLVEITPHGRQVETVTLDSTGNPPGSGTLFGLAVAPEGVYFVDDGSNTLNLLVEDD